MSWDVYLMKVPESIISVDDGNLKNDIVEKWEAKLKISTEDENLYQFSIKVHLPKVIYTGLYNLS